RRHTRFSRDWSSDVCSSDLNARNNAETLCTNMKRDGIEIFTIGFALPSNEGAAARTILKDCASPDTPLTKHFYDAADGDELKKRSEERRVGKDTCIRW